MASHDLAVELADQALYEAKNQGRDRHVAVDPGAARTAPGAAAAPFREAAS